MKATELRIGNLVYYNDKEISIAPLALNEFYVLGNTHSKSLVDRRDYKPIPLTEECLLKFGFEKSYMFYKKETENFFFEYNSMHVGFHVQYNSRDNYKYFPVKIDFVHQLQNLYFALTGEELTIRQ